MIRHRFGGGTTPITVAVVAVLAVAAFAAVPIAAQVPTLERQAVSPEGYGLVQSVRELPDGRVLFGDPLGQALVVLDMDAGTADTIGSVGQGPEEYRQPDGVFALPADSTLLVDLGNGRLTVLGPDLSFGPTRPLYMGQPRPGQLVMLIPRAVDGSGNVYIQIRPDMRAPGSEAAVGRFDRAAETVDTVARLRPAGLEASGDQNNRSIRQVPFSPQDDWAVAPDGSVAVVRVEPYRVEWVRPGGRIAAGSAVSYRPVPIRRADQEAWLELAASSGIAVEAQAVNGQMSLSFRRGAGGAAGTLDQYPWPEAMPPVRFGSTQIDPEGRVWVGRWTSAGADAVYDLFDGNGERLGDVTLGSDQRVVGFGSRGVYVVRTDEFGLQWLERHAAS